MGEIDRAAIRARAEAATEGPWAFAGGRYVDGPEPENPEDRFDVMTESVARIELEHADGHFIAHARTDIPDLLAALEDAERERDALAAAVERVEKIAKEDDSGAWNAHQELVRIILANTTAALEAVKAEAALSGWKAAANHLSRLALRTSQVDLGASAAFDRAAGALKHEINRAAECREADRT